MVAQPKFAIKICGIKQVNQAIQIASLGADAIGVIGVPNSPRYLQERERRELFKKLFDFKPTIERVWVIADMERKEIDKAIGLINS